MLSDDHEALRENDRPDDLFVKDLAKGCGYPRHFFPAQRPLVVEYPEVQALGDRARQPVEPGRRRIAYEHQAASLGEREMPLDGPARAFNVEVLDQTDTENHGEDRLQAALEEIVVVHGDAKVRPDPFTELRQAGRIVVEHVILGRRHFGPDALKEEAVGATQLEQPLAAAGIDGIAFDRLDQHTLGDAPGHRTRLERAAVVAVPVGHGGWRQSR